MSCTDGLPAVEREVMVPASPDEVWDALPSLLGDEVEIAPEPGGRLRAVGPDGERVGTVEEVEAPSRLSFWWVPIDGDDAPSLVELELVAVPCESAGVAVGTMLRVRETRFDASLAVEGLLRGPLARARA